jgi:hypothetical protein
MVATWWFLFVLSIHGWFNFDQRRALNVVDIHGDLILTSVAVADSKQSATCQISDSDRIIGEQDKIRRFNMEGYVEG